MQSETRECLCELRICVRSAVWLIAGCGLLAGLGCSAGSEQHAPEQQSAPPAQVATPAPDDQEIWEVHEIDGVKIGYARTTIRRQTQDGQEVLRIEGLEKMALKRDGQDIQMDLQFASLETPDGKLRQFDIQISQGPQVIRTTGTVSAGQLNLELSAQGNTAKSSIPWSDEYGGLHAAELSLVRAPMEPGQRRSMKALVPAINQLGAYELVARDYESIQLPSGPKKLLRIDVTTTFLSGPSHRGTVWTDPAGEIFREHDQWMNMVTYRTSREVALAESDVAKYDLVANLAVPLSGSLDRPYQSKRIRYRVLLEDLDPSEVFAVGPSQAVKPLDANTAEVTVHAVRPDRPGNPDAAPDPPTDADRQPNSIVQSDQPEIAALAQQAGGDEADPWTLALALERFVDGFITTTNYSQAFATAADVAKTRVGDCTEHSVLLAALARARGIPARVAIGLIYTNQAGGPSFAYHMWNELYIQDRWVPLDATLGSGGAGAARLKLTDTNLDGASALSCFLPVAQVAGRLKVEILEVE